MKNTKIVIENFLDTITVFDLLVLKVKTHIIVNFKLLYLEVAAHTVYLLKLQNVFCIFTVYNYM